MTRYQRPLPVIATLALILGAFAGLHTTTVNAAVLDIEVAPPAARVEVAPPPRAGFVWAPGYWRWDGRRHTWHAGYWVREKRGYHWVADSWEPRNGHYHYNRGHWER